MAYYSFVVIAPQPLGIVKPMLLLDAGVNAFSIVVDDVDALLQHFENEGVVVKQMNRLDDFEESHPQDLLLRGTAETLGVDEVFAGGQGEEES